MKKMISLFMLLAASLVGAGQVFAQEGEGKPIDEVIARVNASVIMRSSYESAQREVLEEMKKQGLKGEELEKKFTEWKSKILDDLINTQLLAQRAKDLSINVDADVNQQFLRMMKENNCESLECLGQKMREAGLEIEDVRKLMGENFSKQRVMSAEVYGKIYRSVTEKEKREAYDKNKEYFTEPAEISLSNIFIALGKDPAQAEGRAKEIAAQARAGAMDFPALAEKYAESEQAKKAKGKLGTFKVTELATEVKAVVEKAPVGTITEPVKLETGYAVFRVDERKEPKTLPFEDEKVQDAVARYIVEQRSEGEVEQYLGKLRDEAFIEIDPRYQFEASKVKSAQIKHTPYSEDSGKKKKKEKAPKESDAEKSAEKSAIKAAVKQ